MQETTNDIGGGMAAARDARRTLARAMVSLGRAQHPEAVFKELEDEIFAALKSLDYDHPLARGCHSSSRGSEARAAVSKLMGEHQGDVARGADAAQLHPEGLARLLRRCAMGR